MTSDEACSYKEKYEKPEWFKTHPAPPAPKPATETGCKGIPKGNLVGIIGENGGDFTGWVPSGEPLPSVRVRMEMPKKDEGWASANCACGKQTVEEPIFEREVIGIMTKNDGTVELLHVTKDDDINKITKDTRMFESYIESKDADGTLHIRFKPLVPAEHIEIHFEVTKNKDAEAI
jgi:hypothetical protein